jgi:hypothetical protein
LYKVVEEYIDYYITKNGEVFVGTERTDFSKNEVEKPDDWLITYRKSYTQKDRIFEFDSSVSKELILEVFERALPTLLSY